MTRQEYLDARQNPSAAHRAYYGQFVKPWIKAVVLSRFGLATLLASTDKHLNDIRLAKWDQLSNCFYSAFEYRKQVKELGETDSLSTRVCVLKEAAHQIIEEAKTPS